MSQGGIFGIGVSALQSYQRAMQVTGHNIANVGNEDYSRQRLDLAARAPQNTGFGSMGTGVETTNVSRVVDEFVAVRLSMSTSSESYQRTLVEFTEQMDNVLADPDAGLSSALDSFFSAVQDVATDPTSTAARQQLITEGQSLTDRFAQLDGRVADQRAIANGRISTTVTEINQLTTGIAELNRHIVDAKGRSAGRDPNDLMDQRDALVRQLSERVSVNTVSQGDGSLNVFVGRGQALVVGFDATQLQAQSMGPDPDNLDVVMRNGDATVNLTEFVSGGSLGALLELDETLFDPIANTLGRVAIGLTESFNDVHGNNMDLRGELGELFFRRPEPEVLSFRDNAASGEPALAITGVDELEASDYLVRFDGTDWVVRRQSDGEVVGNVAPGDSLQFDGLDLDMSAVAGAATGDQFQLRPMRVAGDLEVAITDPRAVAAALPVQADAPTDNQGTLTVHGFSVTDAADPALRDAAQIQFTGGNFEVGGQVIAPDPSGETVIEHNGWRVVVRGTPQDGDVVNIQDNAGGVGDNRGALALAGISGQRTLSGGTASFSESYSELVSDIGTKTRRAQINADVQAGLLADAQAQRENVSGVNLDEEAANLMRYQQAYQAAAQVISVAGTMFDTLLNAVRR